MVSPSLRVRTFYRFVESNPPTERDFLSNRDKGMPRRGAELEHVELWSGLSMFRNPESLRRRARRFRWRGYLARLDIAEDPQLRIEETLSRYHFTVWGPADVLLRCVVYPLLDI